MLALFTGLLISTAALAQNQSASAEEASDMIRQIYSEVSSDGSTLPDWDRIRSFFVDEAIVVLRSSREGNTQFTLEEFIQDFKDFYQRPDLKNSGFREEVLQLKANVYYDIAFIAVIYEARVLNSDRPPQKGIDFWLLAKWKGAWKIVSVVNEIIRPGEALPAPFR
mgnify:FL=1